jgi:YebC/PmpR family DNA-binding regulatory protein
MAGHSKWANIKHRKGAQDKKRGKVFTRLIREVQVAAKEGGGDADCNPRLRLAIDKAKAQSVPKDTIERAVQRGAGGGDGEQLEEIRYEGYGPGGAAVLVECMTDNRNRTVAEVRHAFSKYGGNLGADGSVGYLFTHCGVLVYPPGADEERILELALEAGAEDVVTDEDGSVEVLTAPGDFEAVAEAMRSASLEPESAEVTMRPSTSAPLEEDHAPSMLKLLDTLEELDDVQNVFTNAEIDEELIDRL